MRSRFGATIDAMIFRLVWRVEGWQQESYWNDRVGDGKYVVCGAAVEWLMRLSSWMYLKIIVEWSGG